MARSPDRVVMIGTDPATHGGISAALAAWEAGGLFQTWPVTYIATHRDGTRGAKFLQALSALVSFAWTMARVRCAILHVHGASRASFWRKAPFMALAFLARWPVVFHLHGGGFARFYEEECGALRRALVRFFLERVACVVVLSESWTAWARAVVSHERIACVRNAVALRPAVRRVRAGCIAFVGRLSEEKGVFDLLEALARVAGAHPEAHVELAGEGDARAVMRRARELGIASRVRVLGWCEADEREALLARAHLLALPSRFEGSPMSVLEAMAAGVPVVASRAGGIPDLVRDGKTGLLVPECEVGALAQALDRLLGDAALAARLGAAGRESVARDHTPEAAVEAIGRIYSNLGQLPRFRPLATLHRHPACT
jgi:glycosyltransferase involved in cell wall biosynthesis